MNVIFDGAVGPYERVLWVDDPTTALRAIVAIHSTVLGPAIGGVRFAAYPDDASAMIDALRLAEGMSLKAAFAGLEIGGGKSVIIGDPRTTRTAELLYAFGALVDRLEGTYWAAEDVGTAPADMDLLRDVTPYVVGLSSAAGGFDGDPSPQTSRGVFAAMRSAWSSTGESGTGLAGARVAIQGAGKVGAKLAALVAADGAEVFVSDIDPERARHVADSVGGRVVGRDALLTTRCDILSPCALGGILTEEIVAKLRCRCVVGSANNQLAADGVAELLAEVGVTYVPDFVANAGGLISVAARQAGASSERIDELVDSLAERVAEVLEAAREDGRTPLHHAIVTANARLLAGVPA